MSPESSARYNDYLSTFGQHLKHVTLIFDTPGFSTARVMAQAFENLVIQLNSVSKLQLRSIRIMTENFFAGWRLCSFNKAKACDLFLNM